MHWFDLGASIQPRKRGTIAVGFPSWRNSVAMRGMRFACSCATKAGRRWQCRCPGTAGGRHRPTQSTDCRDMLMVTDVRIAMIPSAVISGRITDKGQPVALTDVVAIRAIKTEGRLSLTPVLATRTNDLGE